MPQLFAASTIRVARAAIAALLLVLQPPPADAQAVECKVAGPLARVAELIEGSGVAASKVTPGRFWTHNDSGGPTLIALDSAGRVSGQVRVTGATVEDWEAIAVGPCPSGSCIYVGDIGDNEARRRQITVYRVREPQNATGTVAADAVFRATYPDGAHDAESLLATPDGRLFIVTKGDTGPVAVYQFPKELQGDATMTLERVGAPRDNGKVPADDRLTDGAVSPDGRWVVLRTRQTLTFYPTSDLLAGRWQGAARTTVNLGEPQGEGVTFAASNQLILVGEGGGKKQPGTFARLTCNLNDPG